MAPWKDPVGDAANASPITVTSPLAKRMASTMGSRGRTHSIGGDRLPSLPSNKKPMATSNATNWTALAAETRTVNGPTPVLGPADDRAPGATTLNWRVPLVV